MFGDPLYYLEERTKERARQLYGRDGKLRIGAEVTSWRITPMLRPALILPWSIIRGASRLPTLQQDVTPVQTLVQHAFERHKQAILDGMVHGVVLEIEGTRKVYAVDSRYPKRNVKVFGHNGLEVGQWWPMQIVALFNGAHGEKMGSIVGHSETVAYSVVTSGGSYEELSQDTGNVFYYSGSNSYENGDPKKHFSRLLALRASLQMHEPVHVLRAAGSGGKKSGNSWWPAVGMRYDGLYRGCHAAEDKHERWPLRTVQARAPGRSDSSRQETSSYCCGDQRLLPERG
jgi:hypothetical protein